MSRATHDGFLQSAVLLEHGRTQGIYRQPTSDSWGRVRIPRTYWALWTVFQSFPGFPIARAGRSLDKSRKDIAQCPSSPAQQGADI